MKNQEYTRRLFLKNACSSGILLFAGGLLATGCGNGGKKVKTEEEEVASCDDYTRLSAADLAARKKLGYTESGPDPEKHCKLCNLYKPPVAGRKCGGCLLFKGPVAEEGSCTYWAPQT
ncbi:hypothetical protein [Chitinophaga sp. MM2321]|uniref:hypothetical protein n=1 Tax=Chitinophaga sp. MM2321 TaxID=3137178 RepID=UPI0032D5775F